MNLRPIARDLVICAVIQVVLIVLYVAFMNRLDPRFSGAIAIMIPVSAGVLMKLFRLEGDFFRRHISWVDLMFAAVLLGGGALLMGNPDLAGGWTIIIVFALALAFGAWGFAKIIKANSSKNEEPPRRAR